MLTTIARVYVSSWNYPGGCLAAELPKLIPTESQAVIHVDSLSTMTGFTRFSEDLFPAWRFDKHEGDVVDYTTFTHIISEKPSLRPGFDLIGAVEGFDGIEWFKLEDIAQGARVLKLKLPFYMKISPKLYIFRRRMEDHDDRSEDYTPRREEEHAVNVAPDAHERPSEISIGRTGENAGVPTVTVPSDTIASPVTVVVLSEDIGKSNQGQNAQQSAGSASAAAADLHHPTPSSSVAATRAAVEHLTVAYQSKARGGAPQEVSEVRNASVSTNAAMDSPQPSPAPPPVVSISGGEGDGDSSIDSILEAEL
jgi:hypothetical protein